MRQIDVLQFKERLEAMLEGLKRPHVGWEEISIENSPDTLDQVQNAANREMAVGRLENDSRRLHSILTALQSIQEGSYGTCMRCETEISIKRLNAVPWTQYCLDCQRYADENSIQAPEPPLTRFGGGSFDFD